MKQLPYVWLILLLAVGCSTAAPTPDLQATVDQEVSQAVAATLTAVPTDTPLPHTPTSPPSPTAVSPTAPPARPTSTAVPTRQNNITPFAAQLLASSTTVWDVVNILQMHLANPAIDDPDWVAELQALHNEITRNQAVLAQLKVPSARQEVFDRIVNGIAACETGAAAALTAVDANDPALLATAVSQLEACQPEMTSIVLFLEQRTGGAVAVDAASPSENSTSISANSPEQATRAGTSGARYDLVGCAGTSTGLIPLTELGTGTYQGAEGGLYPNGSNERPAAHEAAGLAIAQAMQPLDANGNPDPVNGRYVILSIGMSNTTSEFRKFQETAGNDGSINPQVVLVDGAQPGGTANRMNSPEYDFWTPIYGRLSEAGITPAQVQVVWIKQASPQPQRSFPVYPQALQADLTGILQRLKTEFPNLKLAYLSSRIYAGYAASILNPEPFAYESGFAVKWVIEGQINGRPELNYDPAKGEVQAPWLSWGPYLWADGLTPRADGLTYECSDFSDDGTHPAGGAREKVANMLLWFFKNDTTTREWFVRE